MQILYAVFFSVLVLQPFCIKYEAKYQKYFIVFFFPGCNRGQVHVVYMRSLTGYNMLPAMLCWRLSAILKKQVTFFTCEQPERYAKIYQYALILVRYISSIVHPGSFYLSLNGRTAFPLPAAG